MQKLSQVVAASEDADALLIVSVIQQLLVFSKQLYLRASDGAMGAQQCDMCAS